MSTLSTNAIDSSQTYQAHPKIGGRVQTYVWQWQGRSLTVVYETCGTGQPIFLLPAFSTVSTRAEMAGLAHRLTSRFQVIALDWPGFGESSRLPVAYEPEMYHQFLTDFVGDVFSTPVAVVAAGHAAGYVMVLAQQQPTAWASITLAAPTWRGPLAVMGASNTMRNSVRELVRSPLLGQMLYGLNTRRWFLQWMYRRHVFVNEANLTPDLLEERYTSTQQPGGRYAPAAFVTGTLDPAQTRKKFLSWVESCSVPLTVIIADRAPSASKAEMEAIAALPNVRSHRIPGSLGLHEEYADEVAEAILNPKLHTD